MSLLSHDEITLLNSDSKFRNYVNSIEKALKNFESSTEWADLIASLGKLKKVLQACPKYQFIPKRVSVCKRLSQCLHPALPSGVHLKALEVYTVLFQNIGTENLSKDLFLYSSGLFPLLANAALSVKPVLLGIYETYFLPLKQALRPCLIGIILGILPGLEEGSDFYTRSFNLLKSICIAQSDAYKPMYSRETSVTNSLNSFDSNSSNMSNSPIAEDKYFYTCLWSAIVSQSSVRFPAIMFIMENYEKKHRKSNSTISRQENKNSDSGDDQLYLIGNSIDLMINGICCCLQDSNSLVQRSALDLINICLPMNTNQITKSDKLQLIVVAIHVVLRRDMSLNRRIYTWFSGSSLNKPVQTNNSVKTNNDDIESKLDKKLTNENYFITYSRKLLISSIKMLLNNRKDQSILYLNDEISTGLAFNQNQSASSLTSNSNTSTNTNTTLKIIKIVSNLVERHDIGQSIVDEILLDLLFYIYKDYCSLSVLYNNTGGSGFLQSSQGHKRVQSISSFSSANTQLSAQFTKEINELKKATSNFLFQSFQLYFIWDFCAKKFEKICKEYSLENRISPGQLCDLYEFILDLLKNAEMFHEIQTDFLPLMLKKIIQTLNTYCSTMSNQDLTKSILLCSKILKKIVPKIIVPDSMNSGQSTLAKSVQSSSSKISVKLQRKRSQTEFSSLKNLKRISEPVKNNKSNEIANKNISSSLTNLYLNETIDESVKRITNECMNDMLNQIEQTFDSDSKPDDEANSVNNSKNEARTIEESIDDVPSNNECVCFDDAKNEPIFENCVQLLKQLFHTFVTNHLFDLNSNFSGSLNKLFENLFYIENSRSTNYNNDYEQNKNQMNFMSKLANLFTLSFSTYRGNSVALGDAAKSDEQFDPKSIKIQASSIQLRPSCLNYLQSFHILNKFLIKMLLFPRENNISNPNEESANYLNESKENTINSFDNWIKDLFVLSCSACIQENDFSGSPNSKLFEFQSITINTIIELIHLSDSVNFHYEETLEDSLKKLSINSFNTQEMKNSNKNTCFIQTVFTKTQIDLIYNNSNIGNIIAQMLWSHLNNDFFTTQNNQIQQFTNNNVLNDYNATDKRAGILFCLLHEILPNNLCENIIAKNLITTASNLTQNLSHQIDSLKRFSRLWHWSREINNMSIKDEALDNLDMFSFNLATNLTLNKSTKTFERSLLIILDILNDTKTPSALVKVIQEWIITLICEYNDLPRILDILLVGLLHPESARVSIQYFVHNLINNSIRSTPLLSVMPYEEFSPNIDDYESKVTAVSNEGGNVKYHVNEQNKSQNRNNITNNSGQQIFLMTSLNSTENSHSGNGTTTNNGSTQNSSTKSLKNLNVELPLSILNASSLNNQGQSISLRINPLLATKQASLNNTNNSEYGNDLNRKVDDDMSDEYNDYIDSLSENAKNASFLEKYKQAKKNQLEKENAKNIETKSPSHSIPSPKKNVNLENLVEEETATQDNNELTETNYENEYFPDFGHNQDEHEESHEFEDYEDEDEDEDDDDYISDYNNDETSFDFNHFTLNHQNTSNDDTRSQNTEITLLKEGHLHQNGSSSSIENTDTDARSLKKSKRKSDLIISTTKHDQIDNQHQKSLSLTNQRTKKNKKSPIASLKRDLSAPNSQTPLTTNQQNESESTVNEKKPFNYKKSKSLRIDSKTNRKEATNTVQHNQNETGHGCNSNHSKPIGQTKHHVVDALNSIDPNYSYILIYKNCYNMQNALKDQKPNSNLQIDSTSSSSYDHVRTLFILRCVEQILNKCTKEFLTSITHNHLNTNNSKTGTRGGYSVHNEKLLDLIVRHLKSIYGNSFYTSTNGGSNSTGNDLNFNLNNVTYIEAIIMILLFYLRSYYPPSKFTLITISSENPLDKSASNVSLNTTSSTSTSQCSTSSNTTDSYSENGNFLNFSQSTPSKKASDLYELDCRENNLERDEKLFNENRNVQIYCLQILSKIIKEITSLCKNSNSCFANTQVAINSNFTQFTNQQAFFHSIISLLDRCKLQKTLLHCFYSTINTPHVKSLALSILSNTRLQSASASFSSFSNLNSELLNCRKQIQYSYMSELMESIENLIQLERVLDDFQKLTKIYRNNNQLGMSGLHNQQLRSIPIVSTNSSSELKNGYNGQDDDFLLTMNKKLATVQNNIKNKLTNTSSSSISNQFTSNYANFNSSTTSSASRYISNQSICNQSMFISCTLHYLKNINLVEYHLSILKLVRNSLPSAGNALKSLSTFVSEQLCRNLIQITSGGTTSSSSSSGANYLVPTIAYMSAISSSINIPDLIISILKQLSYILHYCLLNNPSNIGLMSSNELGLSSSILGQFMSTLMPGTQLTDNQIKQLKQFQTENETYQAQARDSLLNLLAPILSYMTQVWQRCNILLNSNNAANILFDQNSQQQQQQPQHQYSWILGHPVLIKQCITEMLNPIAQYHCLAFTNAIGSIWGEKRKRSKLNQEHKVIIELVRSLKSFSVSNILHNVTEILKQSSQGKNKDKKKNPSNVWLLQFLHSYLEHYSSLVRSKTDPTLMNTDFTSNLCNFFKETTLSSTTTNLTPACYFQLFRILHDSVNNFPTLVDDKKYIKDIQDSTHKLFELCNSIVASSLQQTTWLRKNFAVKLNSDGIDSSDPSASNNIDVAVNATNKIIFGQKSDNETVSGLSDAAANYIDHLNINGDMADNTSNLTHSLQALNILAEYLAKTLDIVYKSEEKDRLVIPLLANLMSNLLPYLKTHSLANKNNFRAASHLLMSLTVYPYSRKTWKKEVYEMLFENSYFHVDSVTLDYCKVIVDNLISNDRSMFKDVLIRVTYQQSGGLFTSKEQESEQKAQLLKRLAFVIYSSEKDQYQKNMPEIQECIAHVLKLIQSPNLYSVLFLLFRILLLRISSRHLIALWPTILSELIVILLQMEQDLADDPETKSNTKYSYLDHIGSTNSHLLNSTSIKLQIYLSACKLIDLILTLPSSVTNQFQLYKWSFINTSDTLDLKQRDHFVPYLLKINNLLKAKFPNTKTVMYKVNSGPLIRYKQIQSMSELRQFFDIVTSHAFVHNTTQSQTSQSTYQAFPAQQNTQYSSKQFEIAVHEDFLEGWIQ